MARAISTLLQNLIPFAELKSTFFGATDEMRTMGDITEEERVLIYKALGRAFDGQQMSGMNMTAKKETVRRHIKECLKNESMPARF